jgi:hypothetical protein
MRALWRRPKDEEADGGEYWKEAAEKKDEAILRGPVKFVAGPRRGEAKIHAI